jgi:primosomal protein N' (replication factor Y)
MFAEVVVNTPGLSATYHYALPAELEGRVGAGHLVTVPFAGRMAQAIVVGLSDAAPVEKVKALESVLDPEPVLTRAQIDLAYWISHTYLAPLIACLTVMLPPGLSKRADTRYTLNAGALPNPTPAQQELIELLAARGPLRGRQIDRALGKAHDNWRNVAEGLLRRGVVTKQSVLEPPSVHAKQARTARLIVPLADMQAAKPRLSRSPKKAERLAAVLDFLANEFDPVDVSWVYAESGANLQDLKDLAEMSLIELGEAEVFRDSLADQTFVPATPPPLTPDQRRVWEAVEAILPTTPSPHRPILLHGVTGSGKTEIYLRALETTIKHGGRGLVLVPEIALTPQTVRRFAARFPGRVAVWHSELGEGERYDTWRRARLGRVDVVIGPRSALFAPLPNLRLIVLDEEHDEAYKQDPPFGVPYHARDAAAEYAQRLGAICLLGSATPDLVTYHRTKTGAYHLLELPRRIMGHARKIQELADKYHVTAKYVEESPTSEAQSPTSGASQSPITNLQSPVSSLPSSLSIDLPPVAIVDLRQELRAGNTSLFSRKLQAALTETLQKNEQAILFLNRRGTATFVFCRDCGEALKCGACEMPLTYHSDTQLICHHCGFTRPQPERCPNCGSQRVKYFGVGTEAVEAAVKALLPEARTLRWDRDVTRFKGAHDLILQQFSTRQADILVGTQMIAKGLDLPLVTLVGVVSGDVGLGMPDYRAPERTFQILTQVAGRAGRGLLGGRVILQTYHPEHYVITAAAHHDYGEFFARELRHRKELGYPPFRRVARLIYRNLSAARAETEAKLLADQLRAALKTHPQPDTDLVGPAPCFFGKIAGEYRWHIVLRSPAPAALLRHVTTKGWYVDVDPVSAL